MGVVHFYDRRYWPSMQQAWDEGSVAVCPPGVDVEEWRDSAKRLAARLGCRIRCGYNSTQHAVVAEANGGYPPGITDPYERHAWMRTRCRGCDDQASG